MRWFVWCGLADGVAVALVCGLWCGCDGWGVWCGRSCAEGPLQHAGHGSTDVLPSAACSAGEARFAGRRVAPVSAKGVFGTWPDVLWVPIGTLSVPMGTLEVLRLSRKCRSPGPYPAGAGATSQNPVIARRQPESHRWIQAGRAEGPFSTSALSPTRQSRPRRASTDVSLCPYRAVDRA
jgi:hypothetical protein